MDIASLIISFLMFLITTYGIWYAVKEYGLYKKSELTNLLCQYHQRYVEDRNIEMVIKYMLRTAKLDENGEIVGFDKTKISDKDPGIYEKEKFMRFFEELQIQLECKNIDYDIVCDLFSYYALKFDEIKEFHQEITDYENELYWHNYKNFVKHCKKKIFV